MTKCSLRLQNSTSQSFQISILEHVEVLSSHMKYSGLHGIPNSWILITYEELLCLFTDIWHLALSASVPLQSRSKGKNVSRQD